MKVLRSDLSVCSSAQPGYDILATRGLYRDIKVCLAFVYIHLAIGKPSHDVV
jgi:hypothetical protein